MSATGLRIEIRQDRRRIPWHRLGLNVGGQQRTAYLLRSIDISKNCERDTIAFTSTDDIIALLPADLQARWRLFSKQIATFQQQWGFHAVPTLKRVVNRYRRGEVMSVMPIKTLISHFGAVPALHIGRVENYDVVIFNENLGSDSDSPPQTDEEHLEFLLSLQDFLPHLLNAYYEQIAYYFRAIFFAADAREVLTFAHRILEIVGASIRTKIEAIENCPEKFKTSSLLASQLKHDFSAELLVAHAVDYFSHICANCVFGFYGVKHRAVEYHQRLSELEAKEGVFGGNPALYLKRLAELIINPPSSEATVPVLLERRELANNEWQIMFFETAALLSEANRTTRGFRFDAPMIFLSHHFGVTGGEIFSDSLEKLLQAKGSPLRLIRGREITQDIRWSLLSRIWLCDYHLLYLPPNWQMTSGGDKVLKQTHNWLNLELFYSKSLNLELACITSAPFNQRLIEDFAQHLLSYCSERELDQISEFEWPNFVETAKKRLVKQLHERSFLIFDPSKPDDFWERFKRQVADEACRKLVLSMFRAWCFSFGLKEWSVVQMILRANMDNELLSVNAVCDTLDQFIDDPRITWFKETEPEKRGTKVRKILDELSTFSFELSEGAFYPLFKRRGPVTFQVQAFSLYVFLTTKWGIDSSAHEFRQIIDELIARG